MNIRERYQKLSTSTPSDYTIDEIKSLRVDCAKENNLQYLYYCDLLLIDIYNSRNLLEESLVIATRDLDLIDPTIFRSIYVSFLDQIIYIYISRKNYKTAYRYLNMKKDYLDHNDTEEVNRWYLESAYVFAEMNNKAKALQCLEAITKNNCNEAMLSLVYSNMTKLYIDEENIYKAKESLNKCLNYVFKFDDEDGKTYCDYLLAKLCILEKNTKGALRAYNDLFKVMKEIPQEYLSIYLEYINLLLDNDEVDYANKLLSKEESEYKLTSDKALKRDYYKTVLKINCLKVKKPNVDFTKILSEIDFLEKEINENQIYLVEENNEDDQNAVISNTLSSENTLILNLVNSISCSLINETVRNTLIEYSKSLLQFLEYDEMQLVVFDKTKYTPIIEIYNDYDRVWTYQVKKERCYERTHTFAQLVGTVFESIIASKQELSFDLMNYNGAIKDCITQKNIRELNYNYIVCLPVFDGDSLIGSMLYLSKNNDITSNRNQMILQIASKLLESKLVSLFMQDNLRSQKNILNHAINSMQEGLYYFNPNNDEIVLSSQAKKFLLLEENKITRDDFIKLMDQSEVEGYINIIRNALNVGENYKTTFHLNLDGERLIIEEKGSPYITKDGNIDFYVCTLSKIEYLIEQESYNTFGVLEYNKELNELKEKAKNIEYKFSLVTFRLWNLSEYTGETKELIVEKVTNIVSSVFDTKCYFVDSDFKVIYEMMNDLRTIEKNVSLVLKQLDKGLVKDEHLISFKSTASVVRYPRDSFNINDICEFSSIILNRQKKIQLYSDELYKQHVKKTSVNQIVVDQVKNDNIDLLLLELNSKFGHAYEVKYNIRGISARENIVDFLDEKIRLEFELKVCDKLFTKLSSIEEDVFLHLSIHTLDYMLKNNYFKNKNVSNLIIVIDDNSFGFTEIVESLRETHLRFFVNLNVLKELSFDILNKRLLSGVYINESIDNKVRENLLKVFGVYGLFVLGNYEYTDYSSIIYRTDKLIEM